MALIMVNEDGAYAQDCPLCGRTLSDPIYAASHFIGDDTHRLHQYSDAAMHWDCYAAWPDREEFAELYFEAVRAGAEHDEFWPVIAVSGRVLVLYGIVIDEVSVVLRKSGTDLRVQKAAWSHWLLGGYVDSCQHPVEQQAVEEALPFLQTIELP